MNILSKQIIAGIVIIGFSTTLYAEGTPPTPTPLPKSGTLASTSSGGYGGGSHDTTWGANPEGGPAAAAPLSGSVSRKSPREWLAKVFNNSSDIYSADFQVVQLDQKGANVKSDFFSASLQPKGSFERSITASLTSVSASVKLVNWKKTEIAKPTPTATTVPAAVAAKPKTFNPKLGR